MGEMIHPDPAAGAENNNIKSEAESAEERKVLEKTLEDLSSREDELYLNGRLLSFGITRLPDISRNNLNKFIEKSCRKLKDGDETARHLAISDGVYTWLEIIHDVDIAEEGNYLTIMRDVTTGKIYSEKGRRTDVMDSTFKELVGSGHVVSRPRVIPSPNFITELSQSIQEEQPY